MSDNPFEEPSSHNQRLLNTGGRSYGGSGGYQPKEVFGESYVEAESGDNYKPQDLQFQTFQHTSQPARQTGTISNSQGGGAIIQPDQSTVVDFEDDKTPIAGSSGGGGEGNPPNGGGEAPPPPDPESVNAKFWSINYYKPLFNVDTVQVLQRIFRSLTPFRFGFIETARNNPDFYGPFWISTTLVFVLAMFGNLSNIIASYINGRHNSHTNSTSSASTSVDGWDPNFHMVVVGACVFYGYTIAIPLVLWGVFKYLAVPVKLLEIICIYGYALFIFIPVSLLCVLPNEIMRWVVVVFASGWSGFFLVSNLFVAVKDMALKRGLLAMVCVGALHVALGLTYKLYFFKAAYVH